MIQLTGLSVDQFRKGLAQGLSPTNSGATAVLTGTVEISGSNRPVRVTIQLDSRDGLDELNDFNAEFFLNTGEEV